MKSAQHPGQLVLLAYADGDDLEGAHDILRARFAAFVASWGKRFAEVWAVDDRYPRTPDLSPEDSPAWNLGLNAVIPAEATFTSFEPELDALMAFLARLSLESGHDFVVGYYDPARHLQEDITSVSASSDNTMLKAFVSVLLSERQSNA